MPFALAASFAAPAWCEPVKNFPARVKVFGKSHTVRSRGELRKVVEGAARVAAAHTGVPTELLLALVGRESEFSPVAVKNGLRFGLGQLGSLALKEVEERYGYKVSDVFDAGQNVKAAAFYLRFIIEHRLAGIPSFKRASHAQVVKAVLIMYHKGPYAFGKDFSPRSKALRHPYVNDVWEGYRKAVGGKAAKQHAWVEKLRGR